VAAGSPSGLVPPIPDRGRGGPQARPPPLAIRSRARGSPHEAPDPSGAFADAETGERIVLIKNVSVLRPTYQVRMLAYRALSTGRELVICLPAHGEAHESLRGLMREHPGTILLHEGEG
jgi:hypothetical protein